MLIRSTECMTWGICVILHSMNPSAPIYSTRLTICWVGGSVLMSQKPPAPQPHSTWC